MFGQGVVESISEIPPHLKPHYLRQAGRVLADQPAGEPVRQRLKFYDDLLGEVQLNIAVNGNAAVGHNRPFGGQLSIRCTTALGRESGGFSQLLQKNWSQTSNREIDYPKDIEQAVREKLSQAFDVEIVRFHDPKVAPAASAGWAGARRRWPTWCCARRRRRSIAFRASRSTWSSTTGRAWCSCRSRRKSC